MLFGVLFVPMAGSAKSDEVLYCQSELATGLSNRDGSWRTYDFPKQKNIKVVGDFEPVVGLYGET